MIIVYFIIDFIISLLLPINTYFIVIDIDKNKLSNVIIVGILLDIFSGKVLVNLIIFGGIYLILRKLNIKRKYRLVKNIILYSLFMIVGIII